jgi:Na/Pi-cotransporter
MRLTDWLTALTGFGLLLSALRMLTGALDASVVRRLEPVLARLTRRSAGAIGLGVGATLLVQASSVTIITAMGLLSRGALTFERALLIMLGATLGSALKGWFIASIGTLVGPALIAISSLGTLIARTHWRKRLCEAGFAIGLTFLGLELIEKGLFPISEFPAFKQLLASVGDLGIRSTLLGAGCGLLLTVLVQSSSSVLYLTLGLVTQGTLPFPVAASILIGANVGTTSTALIASIGQKDAARRLAVAHFLVKALGAGFVILFFNTQIQFLEPISNPATKLAAFHTGFNFMNVLTWWLLLPLLARLCRRLVPEPKLGNAGRILPEVRKLLSAMPEKSVAESRKALSEVIQSLHWITDGFFHFLLEPGEKAGDLSDRLAKRVQQAGSSLEDLSLLMAKTLPSIQAGSPLREEARQMLSLCAGLRNLLAILTALVPLTGERPVRDGSAETLALEIRALRDILNAEWERLFALATHSEQPEERFLGASEPLQEILMRLESLTLAVRTVGLPVAPPKPAAPLATPLL